jgi:hypothetical protein
MKKYKNITEYEMWLCSATDFIFKIPSLTYGNWDICKSMVANSA